MKISQDYDRIVFEDTIFYGSIRSLDKDEIDEGCKPQIRIWHSAEGANDNYGEVASVSKVNNDFKVSFNSRYSHGYTKLAELNKVINWIVEEVMRHPEYMTGKMNIPPIMPSFDYVSDDRMVMLLNSLPCHKNEAKVGDELYGLWDGMWWKFRAEKLFDRKSPAGTNLGFKAAVCIYDIATAQHVVKLGYELAIVG